MTDAPPPATPLPTPPPRVHKRSHLWLGVTWTVLGAVIAVLNRSHWVVGLLWIVSGLVWLGVWLYGDKPSRRFWP